MDKRKSHSLATQKYNQLHTRRYVLNMNVKTDPDIIKRLDECGNIQGYIKSLIRDDMKKGEKNEKL